MGGKASLVLVLAFGLLFGVVGSNMLKTSNEATDTFVDYYKKTKAHNIATSVANMAANKIFTDKNWAAGFVDLPIAGGLAYASVETYDIYNKKITARSNYNGYEDTVQVWLEPKNFAQFGNFYDEMGSVWWASGDTCSGPFHTNDFLNALGNPVFLGYTTTLKGVKLYDASSYAEIHGGYDQGIHIPLTFEASIIEDAAIAGGKVFEKLGGGYINVKIEFNSDGTVTFWQRDGSSGPWGDSTIADLNTIAPNGVLYVKEGDVFISGTLNGRITVMANKSGGSGGIINITDDLKYNKNPLMEPSSDMLGLVAQDYVRVPFDPSRGDFDIHASIYAQNAGLVVVDRGSYPTAYKMNLLGGVIGKKVEPTATYIKVGGVWVPDKGYSYVHKFDERFNKVVPPFFPLTDKYRVVSWLE